MVKYPKNPDRYELYLSDTSYYKQALAGKEKPRNLAIMSAYLDSNESLREVGDRFGIRPERVRQIVAKLLWRVVKLAPKNIMENKEGYKIFQENSDEYYYKIKQKYSEKHAEIIFAYLQDHVKVAQLASNYDVTPATIYGVLGNAIKFIEDTHNGVADKRLEEHPTHAKRGQRLLQEEFDLIKDMLFRGEEIKDITKQSHRSYGVIKLVGGAATLTEYFEKSRASWSRYQETEKAQNELPEPFKSDGLGKLPVPAASNKYLDALIKARGHLDEMTALFIAEEVRLRTRGGSFQDQLTEALKKV